MEQLWNKLIVMIFQRSKPHILAYFRDLLPFFETNRGGHPSLDLLGRDGLLVAKNPEWIGWKTAQPWAVNKYNRGSTPADLSKP